MNRTRCLFRAGLLLLLGAVFDLHGHARLPAAAAQDPASGVRVNVERGFLTIDARDAPIADVLYAVGKEAGIDVVIGRDDGTRLTQSLQAVPLDEGIQRLLQSHSFALFYSRSRGPKGTRALTGVRVIGSRPAEPVREGAGDVDLNERAVRLGAVRELTRSPDQSSLFELIGFSRDPDPFVRRQATAALGEFGGPHAVAALEAALQDSAASIRIQALLSLQKVEGDRAARILGEILIHDVDARVRRMAVRALARLRGEEALWALDAAAWDPDASVRQVAAGALAKLRNGTQ